MFRNGFLSWLPVSLLKAMKKKENFFYHGLMSLITNNCITYLKVISLKQGFIPCFFDYKTKEKTKMTFIYPNGKKQALTFSFDDNQDFDKRLIEIFDKYGIEENVILNGINSLSNEDSNNSNIYLNGYKLYINNKEFKK